ncbi:GNAT family N-acetyltransferase [Aldersonia kunmingensis]|uniref:GNAT family N-acetyltransferase n=1 Tax=Aldersonia kunmingensis TaxID=408066 RepID=UPI0008346FF3|nr:GNAT family N-acetyltransferase [Aldersonia kunmingensis]
MTQTEADPVLPRYLRDVAPEVLAVPAPPIPALEEPYGVRVVDPSGPDTELITGWMQLPHLVTAWEQAWPSDKWRKHLEAQLATGYSRPLIVSFKDKPLAYLEFYRAAQDVIARKYDAHPSDLGIHAAIADTAVVNRGFAPRVLPRMIAGLFELDPQCQRVMFDPDVRNTGARRLCEFIGCKFLGEHDLPYKRMALYALERDTHSGKR